MLNNAESCTSFSNSKNGFVKLIFVDGLYAYFGYFVAFNVHMGDHEFETQSGSTQNEMIKTLAVQCHCFDHKISIYSA